MVPVETIEGLSEGCGSVVDLVVGVESFGFDA